MIKQSLALLVGAFFALTLPAESAPPSFYFSGAVYELAYVDVAKDGTITNEYVPQGEHFNGWTTLIGVQYWPSVTSVTGAADGWVNAVRKVMVRDAHSFKAAGAKDDLIVEAWLGAPDKSYFEINLHRFVREQGLTGVKGYQYALRLKAVDGKADSTRFIKQRDALFSELSDLNVTTVTKIK